MCRIAAMMIGLLFVTFWPQLLSTSIGKTASFSTQPEDAAPQEPAREAIPEPTLRAIICALPPEVEGVLAVDSRELSAKQSPLVPFMELQRPLDRTTGSPALKALEERLAGAKTRFRVVAGARFQRPSTLGVGRFDRMFIARFDHSVDNVRLDCSEGIIEGFARVEDTPHSVFKTSRSLTPPEMKDPSSAEAVDEFVAFPDDHSVVIAGSLPMLIGLLERWNRTDNPMPSQWGEVTGGLDFRAPVFVLRRYDPENRLDTNSPHAKGWFGTGTADISQVSVTISAEAEPVLELRAQTREGDAAERWLRSTVGFMNADGVSYVHTRDEVRAKATIPPTLAGEAVLVLIAFSGPNFAI